MKMSKYWKIVFVAYFLGLMFSFIFLVDYQTSNLVGIVAVNNDDRTLFVDGGSGEVFAETIHGTIIGVDRKINDDVRIFNFLFNGKHDGEIRIVDENIWNMYKEKYVSFEKYSKRIFVVISVVGVGLIVLDFLRKYLSKRYGDEDEVW